MERALLVDIRLTDRAYRNPWPAEESLKELAELARSSGVEVVDRIEVKRDRPTPGLFIGKGKVEEIHARLHASQAEVVVFGEDLSFAQQQNLEEILGVKVIDRTQLILDIFAQRARSQEGKVQVELAQLEYLLPRLAGKGILLSRLGGGIGTRGPGEQKLEMDRRRIRLRIRRLERELKEIRLRRGIVRQKRQEQEIPLVSLIGYTNAGKTTLLNRLTDAGAPAEDRLFTTLDPLARRLLLPNRLAIVLADTVGFLHRLPHHLVEAFQATLEEVAESDLLLHVIDASHPMFQEQVEAVHEVLRAIGAAEKPMATALNKVDRVSSEELKALERRFPEAIPISALTGQGLALLLDQISARLSYWMSSALIRLPLKERHWLDRIYTEGRVLSRQVQDNALLLEARVPHRLFGQLSKAGLLVSSERL